MMNVHALVIAVFSFYIKLDAVPPEACFANFRWESCGGAPERVFYYWKPGSRCEVGIWQGCLPNLNMFKDEYECVSTCIFGSRALAPDYHHMKSNEETEATTEIVTTTDADTASTTAQELTGTTTAGENITVTEPEAGNSTGGSNTTTS